MLEAELMSKEFRRTGNGPFQKDFLRTAVNRVIQKKQTGLANIGLYHAQRRYIMDTTRKWLGGVLTGRCASSGLHRILSLRGGTEEVIL